MLSPFYRWENWGSEAQSYTAGEWRSWDLNPGLLALEPTLLISIYLSMYLDIYIHVYSNTYICAAAKSLQSCPTLCDPTDRSPSGSPVPAILQARTLEWVAISFSIAWTWEVKVKSLSHVRLLVTPWTTAYQAPLSMGFSRQEYWSGGPLPFLTYICR